MKISQRPWVLGAVLAAPLLLTPVIPARAQTNGQDNKAAQSQTKADRKVDKAQAKADKDEDKALKSGKVKKADKQQDKANRDAAKTTPQL